MQPKKFSPVVALTTVVLVLSVASANAQSTENVLYTFTGGADGASPSALIFDAAGSIYGTAYNGGSRTNCFDGCGTIFKLTLASSGGWAQTVLYTFAGANDGAYPFGALTFDAAGNIYGTTGAGGDVTDCAPSGGCGTVFELTPTATGGWTETILYVFKGGSDGKWPLGGLVIDPSGRLYGTTEEGGDSTGCGYGCGTAFELTPTSSGVWRETLIHVFGLSKSGASPSSGLIFDSTGDLYGTTYGGGNTSGCGDGCGVVFKLGPATTGGWRESVLHTFTGGNDGGTPLGGVTFDNAGNLYGTTFNAGGVFKLTHGSLGGWIEGTIHAFGNGLQGSDPMAGVAFDSAGNLYGTTMAGGGQGHYGTVFELKPSSNGWRQSVLHTFMGGNDGAAPQAGMILDAAGNLYGTTVIGGSIDGLCPYGCGVVFELSPVSAKKE
jgi:uncharacterized repeat protein (TIGR03803 family)